VLLFGEQWHEAGTLAAAMFAYTGARAYISLTREAFKASGQSAILTKLQIVSMVLTLGLMGACAPLGSTAVGAAVSLSSIGTAVYATQAVAQITEIPVRRIADEMWPSLAASALMAVGVFGLELLVDADAHGTAAGLALLAGEGLAGVGIYLGLLAVIAPAHLRELVALAEHVPSRLRRRARPRAVLEPESNAAPPFS
jgi:O-antigen/teichoic acid export membrane protein